MIISISVVLLIICPLLFLILLIWVLSLFFLMSLAKGLSIFVYLFKEPALSFTDLFYCFFSLYSIDFHSDLYYFLPSANFRLCFYFSSSFKCKVRLFI